MTEVAVPCHECGGELYDSVRKYHMNVSCDADPCYDFDGGHWSKGSYCPHCHAIVGGTEVWRGGKHHRVPMVEIEAERAALFPDDHLIAARLQRYVG